MKKTIYTIGHSTHPIDEFIEIIKAYSIEEIVDVRTIPKSRHNPQFNSDELNHSLQKAGILYSHAVDLGGLRHAHKDSINEGWHNASFRGYADYMSTEGFEKGLEELIEKASDHVVAIMCAEVLPWRCHRSMIADALIKKKWTVIDIMSKTSSSKHKLTSFLKVKKGKIIYPKE